MSVTSKLKDKDVVEKIDHISDAVDVMSALMIGKAPSVPVNEETVESDSHEGLSDSMKSEIKECVSAAINDVLPERVVINNETEDFDKYRVSDEEVDHRQKVTEMYEVICPKPKKVDEKHHKHSDPDHAPGLYIFRWQIRLRDFFLSLLCVLLVLSAVIAYYRHQALHYEADHIRYESARMHLQDIEGMPEYFQYLDSVYCIPENVEKRKMYWEKAHIAL